MMTRSGVSDLNRWPVGKTRISSKGFTFVEIMVVVAIISLLAMIAVPSVARARQNAEDAKTQKELQSIYTAIVMFHTQNGHEPTSWAELRPYITIDETKYELNPN